MPETTICHGIDGHLYEKLERLAKKEGVTPEQYAASLGREALIEKTRPRGARKVRLLPVTKRDPERDSKGPEK
ncbi:hypothetical protein ACIPI6_15035 [Pseudomonas protegens]|uniref:hypothetical protein n=1 Tax=Pseudomonas TaxID=286 RepID=UPI0004747EAC|nr:MULTISPECIES: hypothetical protein [Pseudomonas]